MGTPKVLTSPEEHAEAVERLTSLLDIDGPRDESTRNAINLLILLIDDYERRNVAPLDLPTPVEAILFRMEQQALTPKDLIPYLGSASRVSEVLSGKRPLSISMIRALHEGLGIPADVLIREPGAAPVRRPRSPKVGLVEQVNRRRWLSSANPDAMTAYLQPISRLHKATSYRRTLSNASVDEQSVLAWTARIYHVARERSVPSRVLTTNYDVLLNEAIKLSRADQGPRLAVEFLSRHGIPVIIEPPLPHTHLDGVAIRDSGFVAIGLTLRFDRLDYFWFTLAHELAHLIMSEDATSDVVVDDLESPATNKAEVEADTLAREYLIPSAIWRRSPASRLRSPQAVELLANELRIHPAIVAGRVRYESDSYRILDNMVGSGEVRRLFPEIKWND